MTNFTTWRSLIDGEETITIPDSVVNQMVSWWHYSEGSGTTVADDVGTLDASFTGLDWSSDFGFEGHYGILDGVDDYGELGSDSKSELSFPLNTGVFSFFSWFNTHSEQTQMVISSDVGGTNMRWNFSIIDGKYSVRLYFNGPSAQIDTGNITVNEWVALAATGDGDTLELYVAEPPDYEITLLGDTSISGDTTSGSLDEPVALGARHDGSDPFDGFLDNQFIGDESLSESQFQEWVDATKGNYE